MRQAGIVPLDSIDLIDKTAVGSKAASLVRLRKGGLPVPDGFIVGSSFYREHLERNNLAALIKSVMDKKGGADSALLSDLRQAIIKAPMAETQRLDIETHFNSLGTDRLAVRS